MNITESNNVTLLIRALNGDASVDCFDVATAAMACKAAIHRALQTSPPVVEGMVVANVVQLQAMNAADPGAISQILKDVNGTSDPEQSAKAREARRAVEGAIRDVDHEKRLETAKAPAKKGAARKAAAAEADYAKRVAAQTKPAEPTKTVDIEDGKVVVKDREPTPV